MNFLKQELRRSHNLIPLSACNREIQTFTFCNVVGIKWIDFLPTDLCYPATVIAPFIPSPRPPHISLGRNPSSPSLLLTRYAEHKIFRMLVDSQQDTSPLFVHAFCPLYLSLIGWTLRYCVCSLDVCAVCIYIYLYINILIFLFIPGVLWKTFFCLILSVQLNFVLSQICQQTE